MNLLIDKGFQKSPGRAYLDSLAAENKLPFECSLDEYEQAMKADDGGEHVMRILRRSYLRYATELRPIGVTVNAGIHYSANTNYAHFVKVIARITKVHATRR